MDKGLRVVFEEDEVEDEVDFWMGWGGCRFDDDEGVGFAGGFAEATECLIAAMAALLLADTSFAKSCALVFTTGVLVNGFDGVCVVVVLQEWSDGKRCWGQNCWLHFYTDDKCERFHCRDQGHSHRNGLERTTVSCTLG